jgi:carbamoyl-phosphate synthase large subunit
MAGRTLQALGFTQEIVPPHIAVKESVFPFGRFFGVDIILGPEMKSTGEVMGLAADFGTAYAKSQVAASQRLPVEGTVFLSVKDQDKRAAVPIARRLIELGFSIVATRGTAEQLRREKLSVAEVLKISEGRPNVLDLVRDGRVHLIINTPSGKATRSDEAPIRSLAVAKGIPCITTMPGAQASISGIEALLRGALPVRSLQEWHESLRAAARAKA